MKTQIAALFALFRYQAFWTMDRIKGGPVKTHLKAITNSIEHTPPEVQKQQRLEKLEALLAHCKTTVPFYEKGYQTALDLDAFPVVNKRVISNDYEQFTSKTYRDTKNTIRKTSGSTGTPFQVAHNANKVHRNTADNLYFSKKAGYKIGASLYYVRHWNAAYKKAGWQNWLQNLKPIEAVDLKPKTIEAFLERMVADPSKISILGFPSALEVVCKHLDAKNAAPFPFKVTSAIAMAEALNSYTTTKMAYYFNTTMVSRYSNMEAGILAQAPVENPAVFTINTASYHIEILNLNEDTPAPKGTLGRIVITDLYNYAMPLVRYDTGDLGTIETNGNRRVFTKIEGRKSDTIYDTKGHVVSSFMMTSIINYANINQVQLIQYDKTAYELKLNVTPHFNLEAKLREEFKTFLGADATLTISYVEAIPLLNSGKRKYTLNTYKI